MKPSADNRQLLIFDGHVSHKSLEVIELARKNHIELICLPPHCSHKMQPLDRVFFGPLKSRYSAEIDRWMLNHPGKRVTLYEIGELFGRAYETTASMQKCVSGFKCTGIFPFNPDIFSDEAFASSNVTENYCRVNDEPTDNAALGTGAQSANNTEILGFIGNVKIVDLTAEFNKAAMAETQYKTRILEQEDRNYASTSTDVASSAGPVDVPTATPLLASTSTDVASSAGPVDVQTATPLLVANQGHSTLAFKNALKAISPIPVAISSERLKRKRKAQSALLLTDEKYLRGKSDLLIIYTYEYKCSSTFYPFPYLLQN